MSSISREGGLRVDLEDSEAGVTISQSSEKSADAKDETEEEETVDMLTAAASERVVEDC